METPLHERIKVLTESKAKRVTGGVLATVARQQDMDGQDGAGLHLSFEFSENGERKFYNVFLYAEKAERFLEAVDRNVRIMGEFIS